MAIKILEPFLFLIAAGALFYRLKILDLDFCRRLSSVVVKVTFPIMLFVSMYKNVDADTLRRGWIFTALGLGTSVFLAVTAHYSGKKLDLKGRVFGTYQILCTNGNNVFLPVPIISALFGAEYVVYAVLFELGAGFFYWSYGVSHFRSGPRFNLRRLLNPNMVGLVSGLLFGWLGINLPGFMVGGLEILGNITVGSAMLIIGSLVANLLERRIPFRREVWGVLIHRFVLSPAVGVVLLPLLNLPEQLRTILFIMLAMPPLATTALVAASFGGDEDLAAAGVVLPTLLSFVLVPVGLLLF